MNTLIIYDTTGHLIQVMAGDVREPVGIPFLWVEVPSGKRVVNVDVTSETHIPVFVDLPKTTQDEVNELKTENAALIMQVASLDMQNQQLAADQAGLLMQLAEKGVI